MRKVFFFDFICLDNDVFIRGRDNSEREHTIMTITMMMLLMTVIMAWGWFYPKYLTRACGRFEMYVQRIYISLLLFQN